MAITTNGHIEAMRRLISRAGAITIAVLLVIGLTLAILRVGEPSTLLLATAVVLLLTIPIVNVVAVLLEEVKRRDWPFVLAAVFVIGLVVYSALTRLR